MPKTATAWRPRLSGDVAPSNEGFVLLQENGDDLLLQTSDRILLTESIVSSKIASDWSAPSKVTSGWRPSTAAPTNEDVQRITETGDTRITQAGDTRVLTETVITAKPSTVWSEA